LQASKQEPVEMRVGDFRVLFEETDEEMLVVDLGPQRNL